MMMTVTQVRLAVSNNLGYAEYQITEIMTLSDLLRAVEDAITEYGPDVMVVTADSGYRYGARFGSILTYEGTFAAVGADAE